MTTKKIDQKKKKPLMAKATRSKEFTRKDLLKSIRPIMPLKLSPRNSEPLIEAAKKGDLTSVSELLCQGADVNSRGKEGNTALMWAVDGLHAEIVELLISKGADVNAKGVVGRTAASILGCMMVDSTSERMVGSPYTPKLVAIDRIHQMLKRANVNDNFDYWS